MSILSQIGMVLLIGAIIFILIRSNKTLEEAAKEGENFVDEWDMHQKRKEERLQERKTKKIQKISLSKTKKEKEEPECAKQQAEDNRDYAEESINKGEFSFGREEQEISEETDDYGEYFKERPYPQNNIVSMEQYKNPGITLVQLTEDHQTLRRIRVDKLPFTIGRSQDNMLVLDDLCVARKHCRIVEKDGAYVMEDVGSANKIFVHGQITDQVLLTDHLSLYIGNVEFVIEMGMSRSSDTHRYHREGERYYE